MNRELALKDIRDTLEYFGRTISILDEADSNFAPAADMYTVAGHVAHTAITVDWFVDGAFLSDGWNMDFDLHVAEAKAVTSLAAAKAQLTKSFANAAKVIQEQSEQRLLEPFPADDLIMPGSPRLHGITLAIADHTGHHRGSLAVYARLLGKVSPMPYMPT
jgi:uncharacterized damage-inducible protein DinB